MKFSATNQGIKTTVLVSLVFVLTACANTVARDASSQNITSAQAAISDAIKAGATGTANPKLVSAKENLVTAQRALKKKKFEDADRYAELAESDAKLAEANANSASEKKNIANINSDIESLESKIEQNEKTKAELSQ